MQNSFQVKSQDFSDLHFVGKLGQFFFFFLNHSFRTTQVINIKLVSLKSDKKDLWKYIKSDSQLLIFKITLDYLLIDTYGKTHFLLQILGLFT